MLYCIFLQKCSFKNIRLASIVLVDRISTSKAQQILLKISWVTFLAIYFYSTLWGASLYGVGYISYLMQIVGVSSDISYPIISYITFSFGIYFIVKKRVSSFIRLVLQDILLAILAFHFSFQLTMDLEIGMDNFENVYVGLIPLTILVIFIISLNDYIKARLVNS